MIRDRQYHQNLRQAAPPVDGASHGRIRYRARSRLYLRILWLGKNRLLRLDFNRLKTHLGRVRIINATSSLVRHKPQYPCVRRIGYMPFKARTFPIHGVARNIRASAATASLDPRQVSTHRL